MNYDEFAFFNQQLAAMLREGIPLEGALKQLSAGMRSGPLRTETQLLEEDLARGTPLKDALGRRSLPEFYRRMVEVGARTNDLPGVLTLLADHYHRANALWTRLKGLLVYPLIVIIVSLGLSILLSLAFRRFMSGFFDQLASAGAWWPPGGSGEPALAAAVWMPPIVLALVAALGVAAVSIPSWRTRLRWRLPAFREASLAELASAIALMLRHGTTLAEALALAQALESATPANKALAQWRSLVETGRGKPSQWPAVSRPFPPLFLWLVQQGGEDVAAGFQKAGEIYHGRAAYRIELALYGALPISILLLGQMVFWQAVPLVRNMVWVMNLLGRVGD
jgi:type II secretory pathway component PulF